ASFTTTEPNSTAAEFTATITWGDGGSSFGTVTASGGAYQINATHTYNQAGGLPVHVHVVDRWGDTLDTDTTVTVGDGQLIGYGNNLVATQSIMLSSVPTALFTDTNPQENGSRYTATINWGDGTSPSTGSVGGGNGILKTNGSHTYAVAGRFTVTT